MNKQQIIEAIVADFTGQLNQSIHDDLNLSEQGETDLMEAIKRQYMNQPNSTCVSEWIKVLGFCQQKFGSKLI